MTAIAQVDEQLALAEAIGAFKDDPLGFVLFAYPWGEPGALEKEAGPDQIQREFLESLGREVTKRGFDGHTAVLPILMNEASGHGTGKSVLGAWVADWILSTRPHSMGTITAGTYTQLEARTWAAIQRWTKLCITAEWFDVGATTISSKLYPESWFIVAQSCKEENSQAFAGQHARTSTSWYLFDEASEVPDGVMEVARGGLTDGEPMMFAWGQPVRNTGWFYEACFGSEKERWNFRRVDSRLSRFTNKELIAQWIEDFGEDSDWVRVRVLGLPPTASEFQFIDWTRTREAMRRPISPRREDDALIAGFDVSGGGAAWNVIRFRQGPDARSIPPIRISGEKGRNRGVLVGAAHEALRGTYGGRKIERMFVDSAFGAPVVERLRAMGHTNVFEVNFGGGSYDSHCLNMRAYMWNAAKEWLQTGAIPEDEDLAHQLTRPGYHINQGGKLVLESKQDIAKRGEASPDDADALALTFAQVVKYVQPLEDMPDEYAEAALRAAHNEREARKGDA